MQIHLIDQFIVLRRPKLKNLMVYASKFEEINQAATSSIKNFFNKKSEALTSKFLH
jgi:hypothetical protein